jgi:hypothetical protein
VLFTTIHPPPPTPRSPHSPDSQSPQPLSSRSPNVPTPPPCIDPCRLQQSPDTAIVCRAGLTCARRAAAVRAVTGGKLATERIALDDMPRASDPTSTRGRPTLPGDVLRCRRYGLLEVEDHRVGAVSNTFVSSFSLWPGAKRVTAVHYRTPSCSRAASCSGLRPSRSP